MTSPMAPAWQVSRWFNSEPLALADLRGKVVLLHAFQMLCPACAMQALPQMQRVRRAFADERLAVVGLHTVFEHHDAQGPVSLAAFLHEYRYDFPVGVDAHDEGDPLPRTMRSYAMQGTPTLVLIDAEGCLRQQHFGVADDLALGASIGRLLAELPAAVDA
ncbi:alkyl hydroperoxide reductase [Rhodanobacter sp. Root627]|jgi:peroxiredoxin|uniref:TlpA disulfide reductase family protein n=1 Tax=Rhodanobacter sp. Root627 TaxID=1736572 RepID=UPI0006FAAC1D|nr:TlpA disulfide reductase family protein [Rhodanobacter sp. Root627]KRA35444.1 alkyl hydroperoxide reductase [Rhodanobacter sp. Root627]